MSSIPISITGDENVAQNSIFIAYLVYLESVIFESGRSFDGAEIRDQLVFTLVTHRHCA